MWRVVGFVVGLILLAAAVFAVRQQWGSLSEAFSTARSGRWWLVLAAITLPLLNWLLTAGVFYLLTLPREAATEAGERGRVSLGEMTLLIGSAWLLNYLPLSPGLIGRVAYHRTVHRIPVTSSVGVLISVLVIGMAAVGAILLLVVIAGIASPIVYACALGTPPAVLLLTAAVARSWPGFARPSAAFALRWLDVLVWMGRYAVVFALMDHPLSLPQAAAIAAASQAAMQVPLVGNGLGVREWAVGLVGPILPSWMNERSPGLSKGLGLSADLLNRGFELVAAIPVGLVCTALLGRSRARAG
jgi:hypothetical protein